ncbi:MAG TPA: methyltransferase domain-containing protein [Nitrospiria bacterium]
MTTLFTDSKEKIFEAVSGMYTEVSVCPNRTFHFPTGRPACRYVGYLDAQLDAIPETAVESFAGVNNPFAYGDILPGETVLDIGSGSGTDVLLASNLVGPAGKVYGLDMTEAMLRKARANADKLGAGHVEFLEGNAEAIPLPDHSVDVVISNGVLNLVPDKSRAFSEIFRVLRPGGRIQISDIVLGKPIKASSRQNPDLWAECIVGAILEDEFVSLFEKTGFQGVEAAGHLDYFAESAEEDTREAAAKYGARSIVVTGSKPESK